MSLVTVLTIWRGWVGVGRGNAFGKTKGDGVWSWGSMCLSFDGIFSGGGREVAVEEEHM